MKTYAAVLLAALTVCVVVLAGCGNSAVGNANSFKNLTGTPGSGGLTDPTPTPTPSAAPATPSQRPAPTPVRSAPPPQKWDIIIYSNEVTPPASCSQSYICPHTSRVYTHTLVTFHNQDRFTDTVCSPSCTASSITWKSTPIAPGATWTYTANTPGTFPFNIDTQPGDTGELDVLCPPAGC